MNSRIGGLLWLLLILVAACKPGDRQVFHKNVTGKAGEMIVVMSKVAWDKLSDADKALVKKFSREARMEQRALWDKSVAEYTGKLKAAGIEFVPVNQKLFFDATAPVRVKYGAQLADLMKRVADVK